MKCRDASALVPMYLDNELSESQAAPLRRHLLECQGCRELAAGERAFKRWFVREEAPSVPLGFAARVAALAIAQVGREDAVASVDESQARPARSREPRVAPRAAARGATEATRASGELRSFALWLTAVAAGALFLLALALHSRRLPDTRDLAAEGGVGELQGAFELLEQLNAAERAPTAGSAEPGQAGQGER